jgi:hypothetical protein
MAKVLQPEVKRVFGGVRASLGREMRIVRRVRESEDLKRGERGRTGEVLPRCWRRVPRGWSVSQRQLRWIRRRKRA